MTNSPITSESAAPVGYAGSAPSILGGYAALVADDDYDLTAGGIDRTNTAYWTSPFARHILAERAIASFRALTA